MEEHYCAGGHTGSGMKKFINLLDLNPDKVYIGSMKWVSNSDVFL
jgi:hypothetical protein